MYFFLLMFTSAFAEEAAAAAPKGVKGIANLLMPFVLIIVVFYFLMIRPQQKQKAKHEDFLKNLKKGDEVVTSGGIIGIIDSISENNVVTVQIDDNVKIKVLKGTISANAKIAVAVKGN